MKLHVNRAEVRDEIEMITSRLENCNDKRQASTLRKRREYLEGISKQITAGKAIDIFWGSNHKEVPVNCVLDTEESDAKIP